MTQENLELARSVIGDLEALFDLFDEYIVWDVRAYSPLDREPIFGKQAAMADVRKWVGTWADYRFEVEELIDAGDSVVLVVHERGQGRGSGAPLDHRYCMNWTFRNRQIVRGETFRSKAEALEALGMAPSAEPAKPPNDVDIIRAMYERWNRNVGDFAFDLFDPEVEIRQTSDLFDTPATFHGHRGLTAAAEALLSSFRHMEWHPQDWQKHGDWLIVGIRVTALGRQSGAETEIDIAHAWRIRAGAITDFHAYPGVPEALEALELEQDAKTEA